jgi:hypothetical protein
LAQVRHLAQLERLAQAHPSAAPVTVVAPQGDHGAATSGLKLTLRVEVAPAEGVSPQKVDETKVALRELGLKDSLEGE